MFSGEKEITHELVMMIYYVLIFVGMIALMWVLFKLNVVIVDTTQSF